MEDLSLKMKGTSTSKLSIDDLGILWNFQKIVFFNLNILAQRKSTDIIAWKARVAFVKGMKG